MSMPHCGLMFLFTVFIIMLQLLLLVLPVLSPTILKSNKFL
ncbi:LOW QUALITY PROTEIN: hypothetical protein HID58_074199 [Brassica napus]|uniref:ATP synthase F0 subunit 8 n=1 Tax=Brassica napus TaxID=3708 RepID=A0ABQ7YHT5_BRANA|nr:LOW QUALITY PROTEIN: hypothetical protein HID58_074199 [Brassica napus]